MRKVVITGTAGLLGPHVAEYFVSAGYEVVGVDRARPARSFAPHLFADLTDMGQCYGALTGADAVVHLAAIPTVNIYTSETTFRNNVLATYNILEAADTLGIRKAVIASSECAYGICNSQTGLAPQYVPMDEEHPALPEDCYGLGKVLGWQPVHCWRQNVPGLS
jgi:nucleoside-diphosphate-sugar epimerase